MKYLTGLVLTGGEIAAMAVIDCVGRLIPGVVGAIIPGESLIWDCSVPRYTGRVPTGWDVQGAPFGIPEIKRWRRASNYELFFADLLTITPGMKIPEY